MATLKRKRKAATHHAGWDVYKSGREWRWRHYATNGQITKASTEGFTSKRRCVENARGSGYTG